MSALEQVMHAIDTHHITNSLIQPKNEKFGGLLSNGKYVWFVSGSTIVLYSKSLGCVASHRSFADSVKITCVIELKNCEKTCNNFLLIGCSFKSSGILYVCHLPTLSTIRCIDLPNSIYCITTISNSSHVKNQLCDEFKIMSTVLLIGMASGAVYAVDLKQNYIEKQFRQDKNFVNEQKLSQLFIIRKNEDCHEVKEMSDASDSHLALFINENFYAYCKKQYSSKLTLNVSSLLYIKEINTIAIGYSTGHFQLWDCKVMRTIYLLKEPKCIMPVTQISFLEPSDDPNNLCYLWVIQSDYSKLPNATMIALTYQQRTLLTDGTFLYEVYQGNGTKLEMTLKRETGIGRCVSALSLCNLNLFRNETDIDEDCEIRLFAMLLEIRRGFDCDPESYIFLFDINQWYKAQMPSTIGHLKVSNSYASFVKLPHNVSYLDFNISDKSLRPFSCNFRNNVEELYYPSSIYFECDCLMDSKIIKFKHAGVQQEVLDQLLTKNWRLLTNPSLVFSQCLETNLRPFFWDKPDDYSNYSLPDQRSFVVSIIVENKIISVLSACAEVWKNGTYVSSEATIMHLVKCLWKHVMAVKQYADKLCVPLFDYSGTQLDKKNLRILNHCLSQMQCVKNFLEFLHNEYGVHVNVDYSYRVYTLNLVTDYFKAVSCFLKYTLLPESLGDDLTQSNVQCNFNYLIQYANKRRIELGDSQFYLIDAIVFNEPKGNKLIEQWLRESGEEDTKGMYPPSNVQCLLRIYLNAALSDLVKNFITVYFLIDVCSSQNMNVALANRMCNFAMEVDVPDYKGLNILCRASWLLDHDMFEEAIEIFSSDNKWIMLINKSGDWFHWTVLKLLVFKSEYSWAQFYLKLININIIKTDDQKLYINVQIMNNDFLDVLMFIQKQSVKDQEILYEYFFERCRETHKLKCLLNCVWNSEEEKLFCSYLKKFNDSESLTCLLLFLLEQGKYLEAAEIKKSLKNIQKLKKDDSFAFISHMVDKFEEKIPAIFKENYDYCPVKNLYKNSEVTIKCMNDERKMFSIVDEEKESILKIKNPSINKSHIALILPPRNNKQKHSPTHDQSDNIKRRKTDDILLSPPVSSNKEISNLMEKNVLEILNTPLVEKTISSPSINTSFSSILKTGSTKKLNRVSTLKTDETSVSRTVLRFSLPRDDNTVIEQFGSGEKQVTNSRCTNELTNLIDQQSTDGNLKNLPDFCSEKLSENESYEKMDISEEYNSNEINHDKLYDMDSNLSTKNVELIIFDDENEDNETKSVTKLFENKNSIVNEDKYHVEIGLYDREMETSCSLPVDGNVNCNQPALVPKIINTYSLSSNIEHCQTNDYDQPHLFVEDNLLSSSLDTNSENSVRKNLQYSDEDDVDSEIEIVNSDGSSSESSSLEDSSLSSVSDLDKTKYGRFKHQKKSFNEGSDDLSQEFNKNESYDEEVESEQSDEDDLESEQSYESIKDKENSSECCEIVSSNEENNFERCDIISLSLSSDEKEVDIESDNSVSLEEEDNSEICDASSIEDEDINSKSDVEYYKNKHFEQNIEMDKQNKDIESEKLNNVEYLKDNNTCGQDKCIENMLTFEKDYVDNDVETVCSKVLNLDSYENHAHNSFEMVEENRSLHCKGEIVNVEENVPNRVADEENYDISLKDIQYQSYNVKNINATSKENNCLEFENIYNSENTNSSNQSVHHSVQDLQSTTNYNSPESLNKESNPIPDDGFNSLMMSEPELNVLKTNSSNYQTTPFLFGESLFGQQEVLDNKPMLLFGQVYSFENEQFVTDTLVNRTDTEKLNINTHEEVVPKTELEEDEQDDEIQDILELQSLPESNPDEILGVVQNSSKNVLPPKHIESTNTNKQVLVSLEAENTNIGLKFGHSNIIRASSEPKQSNLISMDFTKRAKSVTVELQNPLNDNYQIFDAQNVDNSLQKSIDSLTKHSMAISNSNLSHSDDSNDKIINFTETPLNSSEQQSILEYKKTLRRSRRSKSEQPINKTITKIKVPVNTFDLSSNKSTTVHSRSMSTSNLTILHSNDSNDKITNVEEISLDSLEQKSILENETKPLRSSRSKSEQPINKTTVKMKVPNDTLNLSPSQGTTVYSRSMSTSNLTILHSNDSNDKITNVEEIPFNSLEKQSISENETKLLRSSRSKSEQPISKTTVKLEIPNDTLSLSSNQDTTVHSRSMSTSNLTLLHSNGSNFKEIPINCLDHQSEFENKQKLKRSKRANSEQLSRQTAIDMKNPCFSFDPSPNKSTNTQKVEYKKEQSTMGKNSTLDNSKRILRRSTRSKSEQPLDKTSFGVEQNVNNRKNQSFLERNNLSKDWDQKSLQGNLQIHTSSRKSTKNSKNNTVLQTHDLKKLPIEVKEKKLNTSKSYINEQVDKDVENEEKKSKVRSSSIPRNEIKNTRSRAKSVGHTNETSSLNIFRISEMVVESGQKRVILPKKSNDKQKNDKLTKSRKRRSKSLDPMDNVLVTKTAFGLEKILEEEISNPDKGIEIKQTAVQKKSKFNFLKNNSKNDEPKTINIQQYTKVNTPRRAKSVQPPPVLTLSLAKSTLRRSTSVNHSISDDIRLPETNDLIDLKKKTLGPSEKTQKRPSSEPIEKKTKQKITRKVEQDIDSNKSNENLSSSSCSYEKISPIAGDNAPHMLYTPATKTLKHVPVCKTTLNLEMDKSDSEHIITRAQKNNSYVKLIYFNPTIKGDEVKSERKEPVNKSRNVSRINTTEVQSSPKITKKADKSLDSKREKVKKEKKSVQSLDVEADISERRITRSQQSKLDYSLQSTSVAEQNEINKNDPNPDKKKKIKD